MTPAHTYQLAVLALATVAAMLDHRTGRIPNWLTVGALLCALPLHAWVTTSVSPDHSVVDHGLEGMKWSVFGACACGLPMLINWYFGWVGGGDFKLVAAMGALGGLTLGLESVFLGLLCAVSFMALRLAWNGEMLESLQGAVASAASRTALRKYIAPPAAASTRTLRFGPFAFTGAVLSLALHGGFV
jgi:prepilin peptidase CpaA